MAVPKLVFKDESWKTLKLNQLFTKITLKNKGNTITNVISNSAQYGLVSQRDFFYKDIANSDNTEGYFIIEKNDFVYNPRKSNEAPYGPFNQYKLDEVGIVSPLYTCLRPKGTANSEYLKHYFTSPAWHKYMYANGNTGVRHDRVSITDDILMKMPVAIPNEQEQQKIANFLTTFDKRITAQQNIVADMEEIKKGLLQKIFSQEIRFKDENGEEYPAWEKKKLSEVVNFYDGMRKPLEENERVKGIYPYYGASGIVDYVEGYIFDGEYILLSEDGANITTRNYKVSFLINGKNWVNNHAHVMQAKNGNINRYIAEYLESLNYDKYNTGTTMPKLNRKTCDNIPIKLPGIKEQNKIASFLSTYDKKIEAEKKILADLQDLKKGLLQQMFV